MKFWDREKEKAWLKRYLQTEPNAILFVYGPKSSGKSTLLQRVVEELPRDDFVYYWYDLREKVVSNYRNVLEIFFKEKGWLKEFISAVMPKINLGVFEMEPRKLEKVISGRLDAFEEMRKELEKVRRKGKRAVVVFDELQKVKDVYLSGDSKQKPLVKELFNFFVRLTKVLHLAHVIVMTSDTFFIEEVYTDSTLANTSRFYLVDFFDDETTVKILMEEGFDEEDSKEVAKLAGGVPWILEEVLEGGKEVIKELYSDVKSRVYENLRGRKDLKEMLARVLKGENLYYEEERPELVNELVEKEILFMDPINMVVKFQTRLHERAARELLKI